MKLPLVGAAALALAVSSCFATPPTIYGIHDWNPGAENIFRGGKQGWTVESVNTANYFFDFQPAEAQQASQKFELIIRINRQAGLTVPTNSAQWDQFAADAAAKVDQFKQYCSIWIIGNEMNASFEGAVPYTSYVEVYRRCRQQIRAVQPNAKVLVGAVAPWNSTQNPGGPYSHAWLNYMHQLVQALGNEADGYAIHAYGGRSGDSDPRDDNYWGFGVFRDWMTVIDSHPVARSAGVYLTEFNHAADGDSNADGWPNVPYPAGFIQRAYEAINNWNMANDHRISCACWFAYDNGGFPGYNLTLLGTARSDFEDVTQNTNYIGVAAARDWNLFE
jgi:hypothetical protein